MHTHPRGTFAPLPTASATPTFSHSSILGAKLHETVVASLQVILHKQGGIRPEPQLHRTTEGCSFCEIHYVTQSEGCCDGLVHRQRHPVLELLRLPWLQHDIASTRITLHAEGDPLLACLHLHRFPKLLEIPADLLELG